MRLDIRYRDAEPHRITSAMALQDTEFVFTIEGSTARLIDIRPTETIGSGGSACSLSELNQVHDAILELPFIDRVTVWMNGRTPTTMMTDDEADFPVNFPVNDDGCTDRE